MCACVQLPHADRLLHFSIKNVAKWLDYPTVVYCGAVLTFYRCCHPTGRFFQGKETWPNQGAIDECRLRFGINVYSAYSYKCGTYISFRRDRAAKVCLASVN